MPEAVALIVPCFNEADRLDGGEFVRLLRSRAEVQLVLVDDGSTDETVARLEELAAFSPPRVRVLRMSRNHGKAEAVRQGLLVGLGGGARIVGYMDADLSTAVDRVIDLLVDMERNPVEVLLGSRVRLLGTQIERHPHRHYLGRVFATVASLALRVPVYDTQCGAKLFRASRALLNALETPFRSRWIFDVELLGRLLDGGSDSAPIPPSAMREHPLRSWRDVGGSKLRPAAALQAGLQLIALLVRRRLGRRRRPAPYAATGCS